MTRRTGKFLLVGWDAADWAFIHPLIARGWMPNLKSLIDSGASGDLASLQPMLSPMLWTSIVTGKRPHKHGIHGFTEPRPDGDGIRAVASTSRTAKAIWNILTQRGISSNVVNWYASHPAEPINGVSVSNRFAVVPPAPGADWPLAEGAIHPTVLRDSLAEVRVRPEELDASMLLPFVPAAASIDPKRDGRLSAIAVILAEAATTHGAVTWCMEHRPADFTCVLYNAIDQFCHLFAQYMPPRRASVSEQDAELYQGVVDAAYRFHDMMLGRLMQLAGEDATVMVVSDHGYRAETATTSAQLHDERRTLESLAREHRPQGVFVLRGPGIKRGITLEGASLLDVTPTFLALLDQPIGADMDGRPWLEAFVGRDAEPEKIISWDDVPGDAGLHPPEQRESAADSLEAVRHLIDLGYIDPPDDDVCETIDATLRQNRYTLARSLIDARQSTRATEVLESLARERPASVEYNVTLFEAYYSLGRVADAKRIATTMWDRGYRGPLAHLAMAAIDLAERRAASALEHLRAAEQTDPQAAGLHEMIGRAHLRLGRWDDARRAFETAAARDPDSPFPHDGLACAALGADEFEQAAGHALRAVRLRADYAEAHYHLGIALSHSARPREAEAALLRSVSLRPNLLAAYRRLIELYEGPLLDEGKARRSRQRADELMLQARARRRGTPSRGASEPASARAERRPGG
jgi:predicted AlkP superfamily phosphohydrolase/phosphomutase/tetratricopeptide (TPR) repeat protein